RGCCRYSGQLTRQPAHPWILLGGPRDGAQGDSSEQSRGHPVLQAGHGTTSGITSCSSWRTERSPGCGSSTTPSTRASSSRLTIRAGSGTTADDLQLRTPSADAGNPQGDGAHQRDARDVIEPVAGRDKAAGTAPGGPE